MPAAGGLGTPRVGDLHRWQKVTPDSSMTVSRAKGAESAGALQQKRTSYQNKLKLL